MPQDSTTTCATIMKMATELSPISLEEMNEISLMNRIDTKFIAPLDMVPRILSRAAGNYYVHQPVENNGIAEYETLYYDTPVHGMYLMHHNRRACRQKIRARKYIDTQDIFIEVKNKNNHGRTKKNEFQSLWMFSRMSSKMQTPSTSCQKGQYFP